MKLFSNPLLAAVLTLAPLSALALPPDCDVRCSETISCSTICALPWAFEVITCGEWVDWDPSASCAPSIGSTLEESAAVTQDSADGTEWVCREPVRSQSVEG
ncbi:hypothetical protein HPC49_23840 [Pyxidicoccus fallax]|uniref:Uncharacterized protein n=1 Tax=Pyxidicoccus fallax TaxID=394095 RepID=A0A848LJ37_9BACT|nr:hypothetical protein [Pyxidicoccus fallax]NMO17730.1 hypothetical protein [Pyxidicoccus fallax]NPC81248.1 hypothetical protein [Pyxidicoccus fallax]